MKKRFTLLLATASLLSTMFTSCTVEEEDIWSSEVWYFPVLISVQVLSPEGYSILNAYNSKAITATFRGETFECDKASRAYSPTFYGLKRNNDILLFGELDGAQTYENEQIILSWGGDAKPDTITFTHIPLKMYLDPAGGPNAVVEQLYLNGKEVKSTEDGYGSYGFLKDGYVLFTLYKDPKSFEFEHDGRDGRDGPLSILNMPLTGTEKGCFFTNSLFAMYLLNDLSNQGEYTTIFSPLSLFNATGIFLNGLSIDDKSTREVFSLAMGHSIWADSIPKLNHVYKKVNEYLPLVDPDVHEVSAPTALFMYNSATLYKGFVDLIAENFKSDYYLIDAPPVVTFDNSKNVATSAMNEWRSQKTQGTSECIFSNDGTNTIRNMADVLSVSTFKAYWTHGFNPELTETADFMTTKGTPVQVNMMHGQFYTRYWKTSSYTYISLPLANEAWEMAVVLPKERGNLQGVLNGAPSIFGSENKAEMRDVEVYLPQFQVGEWHKDLMSDLQTLFQKNYPSFNPMKAHYGEMSPTEGFHPTRIDQQTFLTVNEKGCSTIYNPVTLSRSPAVGSSAPATRSAASQPDVVTFRADSPFIYFIRERSSGAILLAGTYTGVFD